MDSLTVPSADRATQTGRTRGGPSGRRLRGKHVDGLDVGVGRQQVGADLTEGSRDLAVQVSLAAVLVLERSSTELGTSSWF
ncbi:MAG: hypothetical protein M3423_01235 [Actinomycetota bacterium]|nr:hypothetical protein [Actinomycetota bacterium]